MLHRGPRKQPFATLANPGGVRRPTVRDDAVIDPQRTRSILSSSLKQVGLGKVGPAPRDADLPLPATAQDYRGLRALRMPIERAWYETKNFRSDAWGL